MTEAGPPRLEGTIQGPHFLAMASGIRAMGPETVAREATKIDLIQDAKGQAIVLYAEATDAPRAARTDGEGVMAPEELAILLSAEPPPKPLDTLSGFHFAVIELAVKAIALRFKPDLTKYRIDVERYQGELVVIFLDKDSRATSGRGGGGNVQGFEVVVDPETLEVKKSYLVR